MSELICGQCGGRCTTRNYERGAHRHPQSCIAELLARLARVRKGDTFEPGDDPDILARENWTCGGCYTLANENAALEGRVASLEKELREQLEDYQRIQSRRLDYAARMAMVRRALRRCACGCVHSAAARESADLGKPLAGGDEQLEDAFDVLREWTAGDPDPVSMVTEGDERRQEISVVVLRGHAVIEMFRQWAERNELFDRERDIDGTRRGPVV